jgi:hypothetical protein
LWYLWKVFLAFSRKFLNILEIAGAFLHGGIYVLFAFSNISTPSNILWGTHMYVHAYAQRKRFFANKTLIR